MRRFVPSVILLVCLLSPARLLAAQPGKQAGPPQPIPYTAYLRSAREPQLLDALRLLETSPAGRPSLIKILRRPMRVVFKDMRLLDKGLKNYDALTWLSGDGRQVVIFVNEKHRAAPPAALAAMLAHEAIHDDAENSTAEEIAGWTVEATVWKEMRARFPDLPRPSAERKPPRERHSLWGNNRPVTPDPDALVIREDKIAGELEAGTLADFVRKNPGYEGLPATSKGYDVQ